MPLASVRLVGRLGDSAEHVEVQWPLACPHLTQPGETAPGQATSPRPLLSPGPRAEAMQRGYLIKMFGIGNSVTTHHA